MITSIVTIDKYIFKENKFKSTQATMKSIIHGCLECEKHHS